MGGQSALAQVLRPALASSVEVVTAGRSGCDVELDLSWPAERLRVPIDDIDVVINTAASFVDGAFESLLEAEHVNAIGALKLSHAAREAGARHFVQVSSINTLLDSSSDFYGAYAVSKLHADELVWLYCARAKMACTIVRPSQLYGELDGFRRHQPFIYGTLDKVLRGENIVIYGSRDARRNYMHVDDLSRILVAVILGRIEGIFSCTSPADTSLFDVANALVRAASSSSSVSFDPTKDDIADNVFPYDDTLYRLAGVHPKIDLQDGMTRLVTSRLPTR